MLDLEKQLDLEKTLFLVSSKSGGTTETLSHFHYFFEKTGRAGRQFVAITDPGSPLLKIANENGFRRAFENDPNIGGRYSVLSYFGLVPAALMGVSVEGLLHRARVAEQNCNSYESGSANSGLWMGLVAGELALQGRDKLTFVVSEPISSFGLWASSSSPRAWVRGKRASCRWPTSRWETRPSTARTACSSTCATPTSPTTTSTRRSRRSRRRAIRP